MKKFKLETKYLMIALVVVIGLLLAVSGTFQESKSMTAYKTDATGSDSARVAKWDVVGVTRNNGAEMDLSLGFSETIKADGSWYFEIENNSEVLARIAKTSTIKFRLLHDSFKDLDDESLTWNFLEDSEGNERINDIDFTIYAYNGSAEEMLSYKKGTEEAISFSAFQALNLSVQEKKEYTEIFTKGDIAEQKLISLVENKAGSNPLSFERKSEVIDGETVYFYEATLTLASINDVQALLGFGATKSNTLFRVEWKVSTQCSEHIDSNDDKKCDACGICITHIDSDDADKKCDACGTCVTHVDSNDADKKCDACGICVTHVDSDDDDDKKCDVCVECVEHIDTNSNFFCDVCNECVGHVYSNSDIACDNCGALNITGEYSYLKYVISESSADIEGYTILKDNNGDSYVFKDDKNNDCYIFVSNTPVDFYSYQKYTSTLGGQPMFEFKNDSGTQTILVPYDKVVADEDKKLSIEKYIISSNTNVTKAWEKLTYLQYKEFSSDYLEVQDSLSYMSYGMKLQIIFNFTVEQVD